MRSFNNKGGGIYACHFVTDTHTIQSARSTWTRLGQISSNREKQKSGHIAQMGQENAYEVSVQNPEQERPLQGLEMGGRAPECILTEQEVHQNVS
jgi:hypothetical protein